MRGLHPGSREDKGLQLRGPRRGDTREKGRRRGEGIRVYRELPRRRDGYRKKASRRLERKAVRRERLLLLAPRRGIPSEEGGSPAPEGPHRPLSGNPRLPGLSQRDGVGANTLVDMGAEFGENCLSRSFHEN